MPSVTINRPSASFFEGLDVPVDDFSQLVQQTAASLPHAKPIELPGEFASQRKGNISFRPTFIESAMGDFRAVNVYGPKIDVVNMFFYPHPDRALPTLVMQFVVFSAKPVVAVMDMHPFDGSPQSRELWTHVMQQARASCTPLMHTPPAEMPPWYQECRSDLDVFTRPEKPQDLAMMTAAWLELWANFLDAFHRAGRLASNETSTHHAAIEKFKIHHAENSPGLTFLHRAFGEPWTRLFMHEHLFA